MESWYNVVTPRSEVLDGRSFQPDEFAIALEQVVAGTAPEDYQQPTSFFDRTCLTAGLIENAGLVLRRLAGETQNTAPVLSLVSGFGGGKTHTLTTLLHLARAGADLSSHASVHELLKAAGLESCPRATVGVFVGNAWDPRSGIETPWIDLARQIAGETGVRELGPAAAVSPPGTDAISRVLQAADRPVLVLCDEVINFTARHESLAEGLLAFLHNLTVALTGTSHAAAVISLPQNAVEMTDRDRVWHERITKVVRRVARDLTGTGEDDIGEIIRRRLFADCGPEEVRRSVASAYAEWCANNRDRLPEEWSGDESILSADQLETLLAERFAASYPFHPTTLSVFARKWSGLPQFQQTRGMLAILSQWVSHVFQPDGGAKTNLPAQPLISLDCAPLSDASFRRVVGGQLGNTELGSAINADIVPLDVPGENTVLPARVSSLDADTDGPLLAIHRRVATAIWFESAGGLDDRIARLPELRLALGAPTIDTATIDTASLAIESAADFVQAAGSDGFRFSSRPKIDRAVRSRVVSLDAQLDVRPEVCRLLRDAFQPAVIPVVFFPQDGTDIPDNSRLTLVLSAPEEAWTDTAEQREQLAEQFRARGYSPRLYPGGLLFCYRQPGTTLHDSVALALAWRHIADELESEVLDRDEFEPGSLRHVADRLSEANARACAEALAACQTVVLTDRSQPDGLRVIDVGVPSKDAPSAADHILSVLRDAAVVNESVSPAYLIRAWPPAFRESGSWPLASLRQSFFDGSLVRLLDAEAALRKAIQAGVAQGDLALAAGLNSDGSFDRIWRDESCPDDAIQFDTQHALVVAATEQERRPDSLPGAETVHPVETQPVDSSGPAQIAIAGSIPPEQWNRIGTKILARLKSAGFVNISFEITVDCDTSPGEDHVESLRQTLQDLGIADSVSIRVRS